MIGKIFLAGLLGFSLATVGETPTTSVPEPSTSVEDSSSVIAPSEDIPSVVEPETPQEDLPCYVTMDIGEGGEILTDIEKGNVGDIVTIYVSENLFYDITTITANGVALTPVEKDRYTFTLIEGENIISVRFAINNEEIAGVLETLETIKGGNWENIFTIDNMLKIIGMIFNLFVGSGLCMSLLKSKRIQSKTAKEISEAVEDISQSSVADAIKKFLEETAKPILDDYNIKLDGVSESIRTLVRCFMLMQENTPESRLAIMDELSKMKTGEEDLSQKINLMIKGEIERNLQIQEEKNKKIESLKQENNNIQIVKNDNDDLKGSY